MLTMSTPSDRLRQLICEVLLIDDDQYQDQYGPDEIDSWDSLATVRIATALNAEFGVTVEPEQMVAFNNIGDIRQFCRASGIEL
jgi:acyl carrier protein